MRAKTSWAKRAGLIAVALLIILEVPISYGVFPTVTYSQATTTNTKYPWQNNSFKYGGVYFFIFVNSTDFQKLYYRTSANGITWGNSTKINDDFIDTGTFTFPYAVYKSNSSNLLYLSYIKSATTLYTLNATVSGYTITWGTKKLISASANGFQQFVETQNKIWFVSEYGALPTEVYVKYASKTNTDWQGLIDLGSTTRGFSAAPTLWKTDQIAVNIGCNGTSFAWKLLNTSGIQKSGTVGTCNAVLRNTFMSTIRINSSEAIQFVYGTNDSNSAIKGVYMKSTETWSSPISIEPNLINGTGMSLTRAHDNTYLFYKYGNGLSARNYNFSTDTWSSRIQLISSIAGGSSLPVNYISSGSVIVDVTGLTAMTFDVLTQAATTTTTTATVTTLTTQTTTADTIVDAVANQFAAVMENLFPALIIILVFVYLAYKAGASGEVLAYVFIITLVLTSFVNLMPWWITVIVSVIMIAILLNYRQRGGGVPQ